MESEFLEHSADVFPVPGLTTSLWRLLAEFVGVNLPSKTRRTLKIFEQGRGIKGIFWKINPGDAIQDGPNSEV